MSRVYKMSKFLLKLYVPDANLINDLMISIYTDDYNIAYDITEFKDISNTEVEVIVPTGAVSNMNDGVLSYIVTGTIGGNNVLIQRQSNYFLKNPTDYTSSDVVKFGATFIDDGTGHMTIVSSDYGYDGFNSVSIDAERALSEKYRDGYNKGYDDASESKSVFDELVVDNILGDIIGNSESFWSEVDENNKGTMTGIMYKIPHDAYTMESPISYISVRREDELVGGIISNDSRIASGTVPRIGTTLVKPWEYTEGVSYSDVKIEPHLWFGGFSCSKVVYFADVFKDCPDSLTHMETLDGLGKSVTSECLLDFTPTGLTDKSQSIIANTVYDFAKEGPNVNGISTLRVILNDNASEETRNKWASKGWTVE